MKRLLALTLVLAMIPAVANAWQVDQDFRSWTDVSGEHTVKAKLIEYDTTTKMVTLEKEDGEWLEVRYDQLQIADRRFLSRHAARQQRAAKSKHPAPENDDPFVQFDKTGDKPERKRSSTRRSAANQDVRRLYDIDWHQTPESAQVAATGSEKPGDDKPIIWFRVLGDLSGFM